MLLIKYYLRLIHHQKEVAEKKKFFKLPSNKIKKKQKFFNFY